MSTVEFHPWNSRRADVEQPDEWRIDIDPMPDCSFDARPPGRRRRPRGARRARRDRLAQDLGRLGHPHLRPDRAPLGLFRRPPRRPGLRPRGRAPDRPLTPPPPGGARIASPTRRSSTTTRTPATTRSPAPTRSAASARATVSTPIGWDELADVEPRELTIATVPERFAALGDLHAGIDEAAFSLEPLLEWADRDELEPEPPGEQEPPGE